MATDNFILSKLTAQALAISCPILSYTGIEDFEARELDPETDRNYFMYTGESVQEYIDNFNKRVR